MPEFHDCQRFIVVDASSDELVYDRFFAIFAASNLGNLDSIVDTLETVQGPGRVAMAVAEVYTGGEYDPLGIEPGVSCLFFYRDHHGQGYEWKATMVSRREEECIRARDPAKLLGKELQVRRTVASGFTSPGDYPAVARWDWDSENREQYIGVRCGTAWCEVGDSEFVSSRTFYERRTDKASLTRAERRIYSIKGWYDEQLLAAAVGSGSHPRPTRILGTILPEVGLGAYDDISTFRAAAHDDPWVRVARVAIELPESARPDDMEQASLYEAKFGFAPTDAGGPLNEIYACNGATCPDIAPSDRCNCHSGVCKNLDWKAQLRGVNGTTITKGVCWYEVSGVPIPGTARWRWLATDEGAWFRCVNGCCEIVDGET